VLKLRRQWKEGRLFYGSSALIRETEGGMREAPSEEDQGKRRTRELEEQTHHSSSIICM
jgi:hypothetical protein